MHISVTDAKEQLADLIRRAEAGDDAVLTEHVHPAGRLVPVKPVPDRTARRLLLESVRVSGAAKAASGASASRGQDCGCL